ncbi:MAG: histidine kinase [Bacteroidota bacterium]
MRKVCLTLFLVLTFFSPAKSTTIDLPWKQMEQWANERNFDSLAVWSEKGLQIWNRQSTSNQLDKRYHQLAYYYGVTHYNTDFEKSLVLVQAAHEFAQISHDAIQSFKTAYLLGNMYNRQGNFHQSGQYYELAKKTLVKSASAMKAAGLDTARYHFAVNFSLIGTYRNLGELDKAYQHIQQAETALLHYDRPEAQFLLAQTTSNYFYRNQKYEQALVYIQRAKALAKKMNNPYRLRATLYNEGGILMELNRYDEAKPVLEQSMQLADSLQNQEAKAISGIRLGELSLRQNRLEAAENYLVAALQLSENQDLTLRYADAAMALADVKLQLNQLDGALNLVNSAIATQKSNGQYVQLLMSLPLKKDILKKDERFAEATAVMEDFVQLKDSIYTEQTAEKVEELQMRYETVEKEKMIAELENKNALQEIRKQRNQFLVAGLLLLLLVLPSLVWFYYNNRLRQAKMEAMEAEQNLLRTQMNPHFTFNALTSLQGFLQKKGDTKMGIRLLARYAKLMRQSLHFSRQTWISLTEELQFLDNYLSVQKARYQQQFSFAIDVAPGIITESWHVPPMLLQPAIENALVHGQIANQANGQILIGIQEKKNQLWIEIADNGIGRRGSKDKMDGKKSYSTKITKERLHLLQQTHGIMIYYDIRDGSQGGTVVTFCLPRFVPTSFSLAH